ncbi:MAG TPA: lamin tail domain-containing protein [Phycisphaerae bacterium]|nr:lamin tail domain-containing protein [Phycisphaerae bacterium]
MRRWTAILSVLAVAMFAPSAQAGTIAQAKAQPNGTLVTINSAVVASATDLINSTNSKSITLQDSTGGITVYGSNANIDAILAIGGEGDAIDITAYTGSFSCLAQLDVSSQAATNIIKVGSPGVPGPTPVTTADFATSPYNIEAHESKIVRLNGVSFTTTGNFAGLTNYTVTDGTRNVTVRIATNALDMVGQPIPVGNVDIVGIAIQYDFTPPCEGWYQLQPRGMADIIGPPFTKNQKLHLTQGNTTPITITLEAYDLNPGPSPLSYTIGSNAGGIGPSTGFTFPGTLTDPGNSANVTSGGTLINNGNQVVFTPNGTSTGWFQFGFTASDGQNTSNQGIVDIFIQDTGKVVITEIMYNPSGRPVTYPANADNDWEWLEVRNLTGSAVSLHTLFNSRLNTEFNVYGLTIPANGTAVIARPDNASRTLAEFITEWSPLSAGNVLAITPGGEPAFTNVSDALYLFDISGGLLDTVRYENGTNGWAITNDRGSIFLAGDQISTAANDNPANWYLSVAGANGTWRTPETLGWPADTDEGSPAVIPTPPTVPASPPWGDSVAYFLNQNGGPTTLTLGGGGTGTLSYTIELLPTALSPTTGSGGTLSDPNGGVIASTPYTLLGNGNQVVFTPAAGITGYFNFGYRVFDGTYYSTYTYVFIYVQATGSVVITEIMHNPGNLNNDGIYDSDWEYLEIYNPGASTINLGTVWDAGRWSTNNLTGKSIGPGETKVITRSQQTGGRSLTDFLTEWSTAGLTGGKVTEVVTAQMPYLDNAGERLYLFDSAGGLLDTLSYGNGGAWPYDNNSASIFLVYNKLNAQDNDLGTNWRLSLATFENAVASNGGGPDVGSPGLQANGTNYPPSAQNVRTGVLMNSTNNPITLLATDDGLPSGILSYTIQTLPAKGGTLSDPNGGVITTVPYTLLSQGSVVLYTPLTGYTSAVSVGDDIFDFRVSDGGGTSPNFGRVTPVVQKGGVIITEIMYNPQNEVDNDWEWIEVYNPTAAPVTVQIFTDDDNEPDGNLVTAASIPAGAVRIIAPANNDSRTTTQFLLEWYQLTSGQAIFAGATANWEQLANSGDRLQILDDSGTLLDDVLYLDYAPWPTESNQSSIYLLTGYLNTVANDSGASWAISQTGIDNAYSTRTIAQGGATNLVDVGSPGSLPVPPPALSVTPASRSVAAAAGSTTFTVSNTGGGSLNYTSAVTVGGTWLSIASGGSGTCPPNQTLTVNYTANTGAARVGTVRVTAAGVSGSPVDVTVSQASGCPALSIVSAVSRKAHGVAGSFDVASGSWEGRYIGTSSIGPTQVITTFNQNIQRVNGNATDFILSSGTLGTVTVSGAVLTVNLTSVADRGPFTIQYPGIAAACDINTRLAPITTNRCWRVLAGDANGTGTPLIVNSFDLIAVRGQLNLPVTSSNFRRDIRNDGSIGSFDLINTRSKLNNTCGACPP